MVIIKIIIHKIIIHKLINFFSDHIIAVKKIFLTIVSSIVLFSCTNEIVFNEQRTLPANGWHKDSVLVFSVPITDTMSSYSMLMDIRNNKNYKYQNFWLFLDYVNPDKITKHDTIECYLANNEGKWMGAGVGALRQMSVLLDSAFVFNRTGTYQIFIRQAMRDTTLIGINDIGLEIIKNNKSR